MPSHLDLFMVNMFVLKKQRLTNEKPNPSIVETVRAVGGLHATGAATPYLSLFARVKDFRREDLDQELYVKRSLGKVRYVRTTVYVLPKDMISTAFAATGMMAEPASKAYSRFLGITEQQYREASERIVELLKGKNGMSVKRIREALETSLNVSPVVNLMCDQGLLVRGAPEKGWRSNLHTYCLFSECFPDVKLDEIGEAEARKAVVQWYLSSFGPVTENDVAWWTSFPKRQVRRILSDMEGEVVYIDVSDLGKTLLIPSREEAELRLVRREGKTVVNLLPSLDPYLMGFKDRQRYVDAERYSYVFDRGGNATSTILSDGKVVGVWDFEEPVVKVFLFDRDKARLLEEVSAKARSLGVFISGHDVDVRVFGSMVPLTQRSAGGVMSPLKGC